MSHEDFRLFALDWPKRGHYLSEEGLNIMKRRHFLAASLVALTWLAGVAVSSACATTMTLSDLLQPNSSITTANGLVFSSFSYSATTPMPSADKVQVSTIVDQDGNSGIQINGAFTGNSSALNSTPASLSYQVTATSGLITDIHLSGDPMINGSYGTAQVAESFTSASAKSLPQLSIYDIKAPPLLGIVVPEQKQLSDSVTAEVQKGNGSAIAAPGLQSIAVSKDISMVGLGGVPQVSVIDQTYSVFHPTGGGTGVDPNPVFHSTDGGTGVVPEPSSVVMMGTGCLCVLGYLWRRRRITA